SSRQDQRRLERRTHCAIVFCRHQDCLHGGRSLIDCGGTRNLGRTSDQPRQPQSVSHHIKPVRRPLRVRDERPRRTNAMIPPPHGFAPAEDFIGYEKNITFLGRELCRSLRQRWPPSCPLWVKSRHRDISKQCPLTPKSGHWNSAT